MSEGFLNKLKHFYDKRYRILMIIPFIVLFISVFLVAHKVVTTGDFMNRGVSLKGGITTNIFSVEGIEAIEFEEYLQSKFPGKDISVRISKNPGKADGFIIDADIIEEAETEEYNKVIEEKLNIKQGVDFNSNIMSSSLGSSFFKETIRAIVLAFIFMSIVVFAYFRVPTPSLAVILCVLSDIITTLAVVNLLEIKLSTAGIAAFLMLIGYSVDTDVLLSTRLLKEKDGTVIERLIGAMKTGLTMNITTLAAIIVGLSFAKSEVLIQIMTILLIGLVCDIMYTWLQNVGILRAYLDRKKHP